MMIEIWRKSLRKMIAQMPGDCVGLFRLTSRASDHFNATSTITIHRDHACFDLRSSIDGELKNWNGSVAGSAFQSHAQLAPKVSVGSVPCKSRD